MRRWQRRLRRFRRSRSQFRLHRRHRLRKFSLLRLRRRRRFSSIRLRHSRSRSISRSRSNRSSLNTRLHRRQLIRCMHSSRNRCLSRDRRLRFSNRNIRHSRNIRRRRRRFPSISSRCSSPSTAAPVQAPYQQYSPSAFPQKKGVDVLAIIACVLAIFIFVAPFLKTYVAKVGSRSGEEESQFNVVKNTIETLSDKVNSSLITQYRILTIAFAVLIVIALAVWIPALIHACKGNNLKAWRFVTLMCIFALCANVCYMFGMKAYADAFNVTRNSRAYKLEPNAIFIIALALISALLVTSIVKRSLMKKQPQTA